jgi:hypothetical protein
MTDLNHERLRTAAVDFLYLLDRSYPRAASRQLVGNRYNLDRQHRDCLHRGVFAREEADQRRTRLVSEEQIVNAKLLVDGHNVIITTESGLAGRPLIAANDGIIRDVAGISHRYRISSLTDRAIDHLFRILRENSPREIQFFLDAPIRQSGELAALLRTELDRCNLPGTAKAVKVPEKYLIGTESIVASSDSAILDEVQQGFDLAAAAINSLEVPVELIDFTFLS